MKPDRQMQALAHGAVHLSVSLGFAHKWFVYFTAPSHIDIGFGAPYRGRWIVASNGAPRWA